MKRKRVDTSAPVVLALRLASPSDAVSLGFFFDTFLRRDYFVRRRQLAELLSGKRHRVLIAELDGVLVGAAVVTRQERLINLLIHPAYRGLRIGRALLRYSGAAEVRVKLDMSSGDPRAFYAALGFEATGERCGQGNIEIMRLRDAAASDESQGNNGGLQHATSNGTDGRSRGRRAAHPGARADRTATAARGGLAAASAAGDGGCQCPAR